MAYFYFYKYNALLANRKAFFDYCIAKEFFCIIAVFVSWHEMIVS